jgi:hypothetical protein
MSALGQKRTFVDVSGVSAKDHKRTSADQNKSPGKPRGFFWGDHQLVVGVLRRKSGRIDLSDTAPINDAHSGCASDRCSTSGSPNTYAVNAVHTCTTCFANGCHHAVRLLHWRNRDSLRRRHKCHYESESDYSTHAFPPMPLANFLRFAQPR